MNQWRLVFCDRCWRIPCVCVTATYAVATSTDSNISVAELIAENNRLRKTLAEVSKTCSDLLKQIDEVRKI